jgi:Heparinase II/III-like protein/Heparinase II/III N-terminus
MKRKFQKLSQISFDELRVRSSQAVAALAERKNWSRQSKLISDNALLRLFDANRFEKRLRSALDLRDHFRSRTGPKFFAAFDNPRVTVSALRRRWPASEKEIIERADRIAKGYFDLLAFRNLSFGTPIDWHLEPIAGKRAPLVHWSRLNYLDPDLFGDKKILWELNRQQYFVTLGQAYWLTRDERYAETFAAHINSWMDQNPPKLGVNWASSLEVAFRSISWVWALHFFKNALALTPQMFAQICKFLYLNARHLETYLSTYFSPNTHLTGEALGLFYLGMLLPEFKAASRWRSTGLQILTEQLARHVQADGVYFEQSSYYHRYTTEFYLHLWILLSINDEAPPAELNEKLRLLLDHLMYITRPDGTTPLFGDDDGGQLLTLSHRAANDFRATLATGAALFGRSDYKFVAGGAAEETLWLLGPVALAALDQMEAAEPERQSVAFPVGGYYVMRDGWSANSNYLLFDCGPHGIDNCGHAHADALSFELAVNGRSVFIDPGTYTYTGSSELRDWFRSSFAHNTLTVDNESSSVSDGPFSWKTIARSECSSWITQERFDYVVASQDGFSRLSEPATHTRSIIFFKNNYWVLRDQVELLGDHQLQAWFHLDARAAQLHSKENTVRIISENGNSAFLQMAVFARNGEWRKERGWVSQCYGEKKEAPVFAFTVLAKGSEELVTFLLPEVAGASAKPRVREIEALNGRAFEIDIEGQHDVLMLRDRIADPVRGWIETARLASDFDVTWARFDRESSRTPRELIVINGYTVECEGRALLTSTKRISHRFTRMNTDQLKPCSSV